MKTCVLGLLMLFLPTMTAFAQSLSLDTAVIGTNIENREAVGVNTVFPADIEKLYCLTVVSGATTETMITHVWYWKDQEMARIVLPVKSINWRTFSSKTIIPRWVGDWHVAVVHGESVIQNISFKIEPPQ
ncbi:MAG: DUF2914 domain-containing protein [Desulfobacterales bacterium]|nr:DUF2914 domain-containing protein [Desulfobacterales bacterium]